VLPYIIFLNNYSPGSILWVKVFTPPPPSEIYIFSS
jgi:hypothetical protein